MGDKLKILSLFQVGLPPVESSDDMTATPTEMRRNDMLCFIVTSDKSHCSFFQSLHSHLWAICRTVQDDNGILNKEAFVKKKNALKRHYARAVKKAVHSNGIWQRCYCCRKKKIAKHFIHLPYNSSVNTIILLEEAENIIDFFV